MAHKGVALEPFFSRPRSHFILLWFIFTTHIAQVNRWHLMHHCSNLRSGHLHFFLPQSSPYPFSFYVRIKMERKRERERERERGKSLLFCVCILSCLLFILRHTHTQSPCLSWLVGRKQKTTRRCNRYRRKSPRDLLIFIPRPGEEPKNITEEARLFGNN